MLINAWAYSNYGFALALPTERTEAILAGMIAGFSFFGCVPREVWWDNPKTVVRLIFNADFRGAEVTLLSSCLKASFP